MNRLNNVISLLGSFQVKLIALVLLVLPVAAVFGDMVYAPLAASSLERHASRLADEFDRKDLPAAQILRSMDKLGVSWLYVTDTAGNTMNEYRSFAPDLPTKSLSSRPVNWHGQRYYEVAYPEKTRIIHAGYRMEPLFDFLHGLPVPFEYVLFVIAAVLAVVFLAVHLLLTHPLQRLPERVRGVLQGARADGSELRGLLVAEQISNLDNIILHVASDVRDSMISDVTEAKGDLREVVMRERHLKFANSLISDLHIANSSDDIFHNALVAVQDRFASQVPYALGFALDASELGLKAHLGLTLDQTRALAKISVPPTFERPLETGLPALVQDVPELPIPMQSSLQRWICLAPIMRKQEPFGIFAFFITGDQATALNMQKTLKEVAERCGEVLPTMLALEKEQLANRTDTLSGAMKVRYLPTYIDRLSANLNRDERVAGLLVEGDNFIDLNNQFGSLIGDQLIMTLAKLTHQTLTSASAARQPSMQIGMFRVSAAGFFVLLRATDKKQAAAQAEKLREAIEQYREWPGGIERWTAAVTHATAPDTVPAITDLLGECEMARDFLRSNKSTNSALPSSAVPRQFRILRQGNDMLELQRYLKQ